MMNGMALRQRIAWQLRCMADRIDHKGAPKRMTSLSVALEGGRGWVLRQDGTGVPIWYYGDDDYERADERARQPHLSAQ